MAQGLVELSGVSKRYRRRGPLVLDGIGLRLEPGTLTRIRGENGSGKSTLLRIACGFSRPSSGVVHSRHTCLGFVPDRVTPAPRMSARSYLAHLGRLAGTSTQAGLAAAEAVTERLRLAPGLDVPLGTLSRGNLRKVILAQALARRCDLVVMDEPFAALDDAASSELAGLLQERLAQGCTFLVATHTDLLGELGRTLTVHAGHLEESPGEAGDHHGVRAGDQP